MDLPGRLRATTLGDLLGALHRARVNGTLELAEGLEVRLHRVHLAQGLVAAVELDAASPSLAEILRNDHAADDDVLRRSLLRAMASQRLHGEVLVEDFRLSPEGRWQRASEGRCSARLALLDKPPDARVSFPGRRVPLRGSSGGAARPRGSTLHALGPAARAARIPARPALPPGARGRGARSDASSGVLHLPEQSSWRVLGLPPGAAGSTRSSALTAASRAPSTRTCTPAPRRRAPRPSSALRRDRRWGTARSWREATSCGHERPLLPFVVLLADVEFGEHAPVENADDDDIAVRFSAKEDHVRTSFVAPVLEAGGVRPTQDAVDTSWRKHASRSPGIESIARGPTSPARVAPGMSSKSARAPCEPGRGLRHYVTFSRSSSAIRTSSRPHRRWPRLLRGPGADGSAAHRTPALQAERPAGTRAPPRFAFFSALTPLWRRRRSPALP